VAQPAQQSYNESSITQLEGLEAVRKRPGMYIGSTNSRGLHHLVQEIVDNAVDEALAGYCDIITVTLRADGGVQVVDNGRGIPVGKHPKTGVPTLELILTTLHAGGKFDSQSYAVSGGLHGVGSSVVNALSKRMAVIIRRDGFTWSQDYVAQKPAAPISKGEPTTEHGSDITFWADDTIFETTTYEYDILYRRLQEMAFLNRGLTIVLRDERTTIARLSDEGVELPAGAPREDRFHYAGGIEDFVRHLNASKTPAHKTVIGFSAETQGEKGAMSVEIAMQWNDGYANSVYTFANTINTHEGGTHEEGFRAALTSTVNAVARAKAWLKEKDENLTGDDIREGLTAIVSIKLGEPQFEGQTKTKLGNTEAKSFVQKTCNDWLKDWFDRNPSEGRDIFTKASNAARARIAARKARDLSRKSLLGTNSLPGKLADCQSGDPGECEIYIVEGDSAGGSAKSGRDSRTQAILPIRGKIINVEKARIDRVLKNTEVQSLITALGTGIHDEFDVTKLRYHKIVLMADADVDGQHIRTLLLTLLFRFMRPLIEHGYVYLAQPPLFKLMWSRDDAEYAYGERERDGLMEIGLAAGKKLPKEGGVQRYKGLGEMNAEQLWETTMDPATRTLLRVTLDDAATADELFSVLMGEDVEARRGFITRNAKDVRFLDI
jgi:DNA gyrase subunit B